MQKVDELRFHIIVKVRDVKYNELIPYVDVREGVTDELLVYLFHNEYLIGPADHFGVDLFSGSGGDAGRSDPETGVS